MLKEALGSINSLLEASYEELVGVEDLGDISAEAIIDFSNQAANKIIIDKLRNAGVNRILVENDAPFTKGNSHN
ncbi:MAG TPA: helix-hairpin-helix domain-containing protein [Syntrophomonadaceae bacterium]|nr:helix-hairpin-helix domain-containing protein [Syntrophomonadaceae bacterium]